MEKVIIRPESPTDHQAVFEINRQAFGRLDEAKLVESLRPIARPLVSLVAVYTREEKSEYIAGHIMFTPVNLVGKEVNSLWMSLAPLAVRPEYQRQGIGGKLVSAGVTACQELKAAAVFVLGHPEYYPKFGFLPARRFGFHYQSPAMDPYFMVLPLQRNALDDDNGYIQFMPPFDEV